MTYYLYKWIKQWTLDGIHHEYIGKHDTVLGQKNRYGADCWTTSCPCKNEPAHALYLYLITKEPSIILERMESSTQIRWERKMDIQSYSATSAHRAWATPSMDAMTCSNSSADSGVPRKNKRRWTGAIARRQAAFVVSTKSALSDSLCVRTVIWADVNGPYHTDVQYRLKKRRYVLRFHFHAYHTRTVPTFSSRTLDVTMTSLWHHPYLWHHHYITMISFLTYDLILLHYDIITRTV